MYFTKFATDCASASSHFSFLYQNNIFQQKTVFPPFSYGISARIFFLCYTDNPINRKSDSMSFFLKIKHWQLFGLLIVIPMVLQVLLSGRTIVENVFSRSFDYFPLVMIIFTVLFFGWQYSIGTKLYRKIPQTVKMNLTRFKICIFVPLIYICILTIFMICFLNGLLDLKQVNSSIFSLVILIHMFAMFCIFYCFYFIAKVLKAAEIGRSVIFNDFSGDFFLLWFYPIGIWIIQPRINKIFNKNK